MIKVTDNRKIKWLYSKYWGYWYTYYFAYGITSYLRQYRNVNNQGELL